MERYDSRFSITMIDIDHFKQVNDEHGHLNGDRILQDVAKLVDESARETDIVARYGGEEFVVIMPHTELPGAGVFTERLRELIQGQLPVTISGGVATALDGDTTETLVARADAALYRAKSAGRNCIFRHTGEQIESVVEAASVTVVEAAPVTPA
jgi:diguanylate cyclase (GGDEF)-like protein